MSRDPVDKNLLQMAARRFVSRCDTQIFSSIGRAESRARELIHHHIQNCRRAEPVAREKFKRAMLESWSNLRADSR